MTIYNFSAGPAALPKSVMQKAQAEYLDYNSLGTSVMEISHRSSHYIEVAEKAETDLRDLLHIPNNYKVLFMQGGGRGQFFSVPMNLAQRGKQAVHLISGQWSKIALNEANKYLSNTVVANTVTNNGKISVPPQSQWLEAGFINQNSAYFHYCPNETVEGIEINWLPQTGDVPLVADMSSNILSKTLDVSKFGIIYAGAQKNIGPSGLAVVIVRDDLLEFARSDTPAIFNYKEQAAFNSMYNTPPTFSWYLAGLVFEWLKNNGGINTIQAINQQKAKLLYDCIDNSSLYSNHIVSENRSKMNVTFHLAEPALESTFLTLAEKSGLLALKGHRAVGGMRASIYNAMELDGVKVLTEFMQEFERTQS